MRGAEARIAHGDRALREWVEELALLYEREGLPRMAGRIFGWLLVCEPPEQTMEALAAALQGSKASMSTMTRLLERAGLVERVRPPGERRDRFRVPLEEGWDNLWQSRLKVLTDTEALFARGHALLAGRSREARRRIEEMHGIYRWFTAEFPRLLERWNRQRLVRRRSPRGGVA